MADTSELLVALLQQDVVSVPQALLALKRQKKRPEVALWRLVAELKDVDSEGIYAMAAELQEYASVHVTSAKPSDDLIEAVRGLFPPHVGKRMLEIGLLPYDFVMNAQQKQHTLVFVSQDPSHPEIRDFLEGLGVEVELRFASGSLISDRLRRALKTAADPEAQQENAAQQTQAQHLQQRNAAKNVQARAAANEREAESVQEEEEREATSFESEPIDPIRDPSPGITSDDLRKLLGTEAEAEKDVLVDEEENDTGLSTYSGDGYSDDNVSLEPPASDIPDDEQAVDDEASEQEPPDGEPALGRTEWTGGDGASDGPGESPDDKDEAPPPNLDAIKSKDRVVAMLLRKQIIVPEDVQRAQARQKKEGLKDALWRVIAGVSGVDRDTLVRPIQTFSKR